MKILGFDPGWGKAGWAMVDFVDGGDGIIVSAGILKPKATTKAILALPKTAQIEHALTRLAGVLRLLQGDIEEPDLVVVEHRQPFPGKGAGGWKTSLVQGAIFLHWVNLGVQTVLVHPAQVRAVALSKKKVNAEKTEKEDAVQAAEARWGVPWKAGIPRGQWEHVCDAAHAALAAWRKHGRPDQAA